ncbi:DsbA family protein [Rugosimonospora acidiphila]|uniref:DsbA family protein n=1 Tax=Rugosimonospora acidiphila TaxID=556531 RepID=A0ABP9RP80_9ACTN
MTADVTFWFDPICPFTWRTSRWVKEVTQKRNLVVSWRLMSLATLNAGKDVPEEYREPMARGARASRLIVAAGQRSGEPAVERLYTEIGTRVHWDGRELSTELLQESLEAAGLPAELLEVVDDPSLDQAIRDSHAEGQTRVGTESGSPIIAIGEGPGFFGPVVSPVPEGEAAEKLFDAVRLLAAVPEFSELKRSRNPF